MMMGTAFSERLGELFRVLLDLPNHAALVLELVDRVLELLVEDHAVRRDDHAVEHALVDVVVQRRQTVSQPADGVALAAARRVLDQVVAAHALGPSHPHQLSDRIELVVARKYHRLALDPAPLVVAPLFDLQVHEAREQLDQALALQHFLPQIGGAIVAAAGIGRVARPALPAPVERQEVGSVAGEPGRHARALGVDREVHERAPLELEDRLAGIAVTPVLAHRVVDRLPGQRVFELRCDDGNAVQAQGDVERLFRSGREVELPRNAEPVGGVTDFEIRVQPVRRLEEGDPQRVPVALEAVAQRRERTVGVHPLAEVAEHLVARTVAA